MEFEKVIIDKKLFYWTWRDLPFLPYSWLDEKDLKKLPKPFFLSEIHPDCNIGTESKYEDELTNIIELPDRFDKLNLDNDLRKDLKRVEKKNAEIKLVYNEKDALDKSKKWFLELWKEDKRDFQRRLKIWKEKCYTISAYLGKELIAVHIAMKNEEEKTIFYLGCWWNRKHKSLSTPTFLLKKDIEKAISDGFKYYDLEIGDQAYKKKWGVIEKPSKYYAVLTKELADYLEVEHYVEMEDN
ncbi:GNAT family N-acetyltransferase [Candidatus Pacearchaeota archaeon]|nr:GNAT family N-acetyltransferase [Candidatus Pacearchaeota archaeon]